MTRRKNHHSLARELGTRPRRTLLERVREPSSVSRPRRAVPGPFGEVAEVDRYRQAATAPPLFRGGA